MLHAGNANVHGVLMQASPRDKPNLDRNLSVVVLDAGQGLAAD